EAASRGRADVRIAVLEPAQNRRRRLRGAIVAEPVGGGGAAPRAMVTERADLRGVCLRAREVLADPLPGVAAHAPREPPDRLGEEGALLGVQPALLGLGAVDERERERAQARLQLRAPAP